MLRNIGLAGVWILARFDHPEQLHHTAVLVRQYVAVQHIRAGEIHKLMSYAVIHGLSGRVFRKPAPVETAPTVVDEVA